MCNDSERKLTPEEKTQITVGYKVFNQRSDNTLCSLFAHGKRWKVYIYKNPQQDGFFHSAISPINTKKEDGDGNLLQKGFHFFLNQEDAVNYAIVARCDKVMKVAVENVYAIGSYRVPTKFGDDCSTIIKQGYFANVARCGKLKILEEIPIVR